MRVEYEHSADLRAAREHIIGLRKKLKRLHFISGGKGYDNMGARELEQVRVKIDEAEHWLGAAGQSLNAGGGRAFKLGFGPPEETEPDANGCICIGNPLRHRWYCRATGPVRSSPV